MKKRKKKLSISKSGLMLSLVLFILIVLYIATPSYFQEGIKGSAITLQVSLNGCEEFGGICAETCPNGYIEESSLTSECSFADHFCGDGTCDFDEDCSTCPGDCDCLVLCDDETPSGECNPELTGYCDEGVLIYCPEGYTCDPSTGVCEFVGPGEGFCGDGNCDAMENCETCPDDCPTPLGQVCCYGEAITGDCCSSADCLPGQACEANRCCNVACTIGSCPSGQICAYPGTCNSYCYLPGGSSPLSIKTTGDAIMQTGSLKCCIPSEETFTEEQITDEFVTGKQTDTGEIIYIIDLTTSNKRVLKNVPSTALMELIIDIGTIKSYTIKITSLTENSVILLIGDLTVNINKLESKNIDLNNDGKIDLTITVNDIKGDTIDLTFEKYGVKKQTEEEKVVGGLQPETQEKSFEQKYIKKILLIVIIVLAAVVLTLVIKENLPGGGSPPKDLDNLLDKAGTYIGKGKFDSGLKLYSKIDHLFSRVSEKHKTPELEEKVNRIKNTLALYLKTKEALILAKNKNLDKLKETLDSMNSLKQEVKTYNPLSFRLMKYVENKQNYLKDNYIENYSRKQFFKTLEKIKFLLSQRNKEEAIKNYNELIRFYNTLVKNQDYQTRQFLYSRVLDVRNRIQNPIYPKQEIIQKPILKSQKVKEPIKSKVKATPLKNPFHKLHNLIKENNYNKAINLYYDLYGL